MLHDMYHITDIATSLHEKSQELKENNILQAHVVRIFKGWDSRLWSMYVVHGENLLTIDSVIFGDFVVKEITKS